MQSFIQLKKNLKKDTLTLKQVSVAVLADSASQLMTQALKGYGVEAGFAFNIYEAEYDQINNEIFSETSELYAFQPEFVFIDICSEHLLKSFFKDGFAARSSFADRHIEYLQSLVQTVSSRSAAKIIFTNYAEIDEAVFGNYANKLEISFIYQMRKLNLHLMDLAAKYSNVFICDLLSLQLKHGYNAMFSPKLYINGDMVYDIDFLPHIAKQITDIIASVKGSFKKCIILDLDNTLWGGIIGDDGLEGIQLGSLGIGKAFTELQLWVRQLKERGVIIAVCSKNTEAIAREPFEKHPDMVLRMDDVAVFVANWETKVDNIRYIQQILNIGFDSMVFLDDNPFEREMVKTAIPDITVPELPEDPAEYLNYLRSLNLFETASFTHADSGRTKQYQEEAQRHILQKSFANEEEFLSSLNMVATVTAFDKFSVPRVAQLSQRSNQFNLRTVRYTEADIVHIASGNNYLTFSFSLEDKFGHYGLIAAIILKAHNTESLFIDTWIMSCRVLKRGMENFTLNKITEAARGKGYKYILGEYIPTAKNALVKDHYLNLGFEPVNGFWKLDLETFIPAPTFINEQTILA